MKKVDPSKNIHWMSPYNVPALTIDSGESVLFTCRDTWDNTITGSSCVQGIHMAGHIINPLNGPVYVNGAAPGDTLKVTIEDIKVTSDAYLITNERQCGPQLQKYVTDEEIFTIEIKDGKADMFGNIIDLKPFPGCIGVAPKEKMNTMGQGAHGGNMDCKEFVKGTVIYFPVFVPGALAAVGDLHAHQGDGEVVAGLEVAGQVQLKLEVIKGISEAWPVYETLERWGVVACADTLDKAAELSLQHTVEFILKRSRRYTPNQVMLLLSILGDAQVCEMVDTYMEMRYSFEKRILPELEF